MTHSFIRQLVLAGGMAVIAITTGCTGGRLHAPRTSASNALPSHQTDAKYAVTQASAVTPATGSYSADQMQAFSKPTRTSRDRSAPCGVG